MKHISLLVPKDGILGSIEGPRQLLTQVNHFFTSKGAQPLFKLQLVGLSKTTSLSGGLFTANADVLLHEVSKTDLIIIPAVDGDLTKALDANAEFIPWITKHYKAGAKSRVCAWVHSSWHQRVFLTEGNAQRIGWRPISFGECFRM